MSSSSHPTGWREKNQRSGPGMRAFIIGNGHGGVSAVFAVAVDQKQVNTVAHCSVWNIRARPGSFSALADIFFFF